MDKATITYGKTTVFQIPKTQHFVYIIATGQSSRTYTGYTTDPVRRVMQHNRVIAGGAATTATHKGKWKLLALAGGFHNQKAALRFEAALQKPKDREWLVDFCHKYTALKIGMFKHVGVTNKLQSLTRLATLFPLIDARQKSRIRVHIFSHKLARLIASARSTMGHDAKLTVGAVTLTYSHPATLPNPRVPSGREAPDKRAKYIPGLETVDKKLAVLAQHTPKDRSELDEYYTKVIEALSEASGINRAPRKRPTDHNKRHRKEKALSGTQLATKARMLYWTDRKKLHRLLDTGRIHGEALPIAYSELLSHHRTEASEVEPELAGVPWERLEKGIPGFDPSVATDAALTDDITPDDIVKAINASNPQSTGSRDDQVTSKTLQTLSRLKGTPATESNIVKVLLPIMSLCFTSKKSIDKWRQSSAVLLLKPGKDKFDVRSWRHIVLASAVYKVYTSILTDRLSRYVSRRLSPHQHGFQKHVGRNYHLFSLLQLIRLSKEAQTDFYAVFIDFTNAFGTVPFQSIQRGLRAMKCPNHFIQVVEDLYDNISMYFTDPPPGDDDLIRLARGVKQGCPLSPIIFLLTIDPLLKWLDLDEQGICLRLPKSAEPSTGTDSVAQQTFADDLVILPKTRSDVTSMLKKVTKFCQETGLSIKNDKCGTILAPKGAATHDDSITIKGKRVPIIHPLGDKPSYKYLGLPLSFNINWDEIQKETEMELVRRIDKVSKSGLYPLQKLSTLCSWAFPLILTHNPIALFNPTWLGSVDKQLSATARSWISSSKGSPLPNTIPTLHLTTPRREGGYGLPSSTASFIASRIKFTCDLLRETNLPQHQLAHTIAKSQALQTNLRAQLTSPELVRTSRHTASLSFWDGVVWALQDLGLGLAYKPGGFYLTVNTFASWPQSPPKTWSARHITPLRKQYRKTGLSTTKVRATVSFASRPEHPNYRGLAVLLVSRLNCWVYTRNMPKTSATSLTIHGISAVLDKLEGEIKPNTPVTINVPTKYVVDVLLGIAPIQQSHKDIVKLRRRLTTFTNLTLSWVPTSLRTPEPLKTSRLAIKALRNKGKGGWVSTGRPKGHNTPLNPHRYLRCSSLEKRTVNELIKNCQTNSRQSTAASMNPRREQILDPLLAKVSYSVLKSENQTRQTLRAWSLLRFGIATLGIHSLCARRCGHAFTQGHLLSSCPHYKGYYTTRHDKAVKSLGHLLARAYPDQQLIVNTSTHREKIPIDLFPPNAPQHSKDAEPDVVMIDRGNKLIRVLELGISNTWNKEPSQRRKEAQYNTLERVFNKPNSCFTCNRATLLVGVLGEVPRSALEKLCSLFSQINHKDAVRTLSSVSKSTALAATSLFRMEFIHRYNTSN